jgi:two-component system, OmpR family, sensor kinase
VSLRVTLLAAFTYALLAVLIALLLPLTLNISRRVDAEIKAEALGQVSLVATSAADEINRPERLRELVERSAEALGGRLIVTDQAGRIVADSAGTGLEGADYGDRPEVAAALAGENSQGRRDSELLGEELLFTAAPVIEQGRTVGAVRATQSVAAVNDAVRDDVLVLIGAGAAALLLGVGVAWVLAGFLTRPLESLTTTARRVAAGDLDARAPARGSREQRQVASAFNEMTGRLQGALEAQREFVANASHQLRTPLTGLRLRLEAAADGVGDPQIREELHAAEDEVERLAALLTNLLVLAREGQEPPEPEPVDLERGATDARERWAAEADARGFRIRLDGGPAIRVMASPDDVGIMLDNLIENALKYSGDGGEVLIEWGRRGDRGFVAISDDGPGLAVGEHERMLDRFARGSGATASGTGLGLAIVSALARRWRGSVELRDREPRGLCAVVTLPLQSHNPAGLASIEQ